MNKLKNILSFFLQLLVLPIAAYLLFSLWMEQELGIIFYQRLLSVHALLRDQKTGFEPHLQTGRKV